MKKDHLVPEFFSHLGSDELLHKLKSDPYKGLSHKLARKRLKFFGANALKTKEKTHLLAIFFSQFNNPLIYLLLFAGSLSLFLSDGKDAWIIFAIIFISSVLSFLQKKGAIKAIQALLTSVQTKNKVLRDGDQVVISSEEIVPGDILLLKAGDIIPGDGLILESRDFHLDESTLTGESHPVEKQPGRLAPNLLLAERSNTVFFGTHVICGFAKVLIVHTGKKTEFGKLASRLDIWQEETTFEQGIRRFSRLLIEITFVLVLAIFAINLYFERPFIESLLFALALSIGLTPQLLPAIITINLATGAKQMGKRGAIVKKLVAIENFGSMDLLCADKTGTLTEGKFSLKSGVDCSGRPDDKILQMAALNAHFQTGYENPIDEAIKSAHGIDFNNWKKLDEIPYDFTRKRLSILVENRGDITLITKGSFPTILSICSHFISQSGEIETIEPMREALEKLYESYTSQGYHTLALAMCKPSKQRLELNDESSMIFVGFLLFFDPPKEDVVGALSELKRDGVGFKMVTGDHSSAALHLAHHIGLENVEMMTGAQIHATDDQALIHCVKKVSIFAEVEPSQKERIIMALRKGGYAIGFLGDGVNDIAAMHAADIGICVNTAADPVKEVADIVLLSKDLSLLKEGILAGRATFANTLKYIFMATSANFGNMFSMAGASLFLNFLPLLPKQILAINLLTDLPEMTIATDGVDREMISAPLKWDLKFIKKFMITFGLISSFFDYMTFALLFFGFRATQEEFRTGWFIESILSAALIVLIVRTFKPFYRSRPSRMLFSSVILISLFTLCLPFIPPLAALLNLTPLSHFFFLAIFGIIILYAATVEVAKRVLYTTARRYDRSH